MNYKHLLKFYFCAEAMNGALDALLIRFATASAESDKGCEYFADKMCRVIEAKAALGQLWAFLDSVLSSVTEEDRKVLKAYTESRRKERGADGKNSAEGRALHRSLMKFSRRVNGRLDRFAEQVNVLRDYYCFVREGG